MSMKKQNVDPQMVSKIISKGYLATFFKLPAKKLLFAVVETTDDDGSVNISPAVAVFGSQEYLSLSEGGMKTTARAKGVKQDLYPAIVCYHKDTDTFKFRSSVNSCVSISAEKLIFLFGEGVIRR